MNKKFRKLILPVSLLIASQSYGLGLGNLQVNSALDEVLEGKIPFILDGTEEIEKIKVAVASNSDYERVGLDKSFVPSNITVEILEEGGGKYIQISSKGPVSEPIVSLLLVVDWANGHLLREYTLLLDPPIFTSTSEQSYSEPVQTQTYEAPEIIEDSNQAVDQEDSNISFRQSNQVVVKSGDTLWKIAKEANTGSSSIQQTMVAIFNNNISSFQNDNMNLLKKGATLIIPDSDQVAMVSTGQAEEDVKLAVQNWSRLQNIDSDSNSASSTNVDYGIELVPPNDSDSTDTNNASGSNAEKINARTMAELNKAKEELASYNLENSELSSRVAELEQIVKDQELALSMKDSNLAQLQNQISSQDDLNNTDISDDTLAVANDTSLTGDEVSGEDDVWDESLDTEQLASIETDEQVDEQLTDDSSDIVIDDGLIEVADTDSDEANETNEKLTVEKPQVAQNKPSNKEKTFMEKMMDYKFEGLIGLGVLLLGLLGFTYFKRKNKDDETGSGDFLDSISNKNNMLGGDSESTELDLSNLEDDIDDELHNIGDEAQDISDELNDIDDELQEIEPEVDVMNEESELSEDDFDLDIEDVVTEDAEDGENAGETDLSDMGFDNLELNEEGEIEGLEEDTDNDLNLDFENNEFDDLDDKESTEQQLEDDFDLDLGIGQDDNELDEVVGDSDELEELVFDTGERSIIVDETENNESNVEEDLEFDIDEDLFATDDLDLDFDEEDSDKDDEKTELSIDALSVDDIESNDDELTLEIEEDNDKTELDLDTLDLDEIEEPEEEVDIGLDFDDMVDDDAIDTKLDLAKAYFEMGDNAGASQMIEEILEEGSDEQKAKAEELKNELNNS